MEKNNCKKGFTLVEVLVSLFIIVLLSTLIFVFNRQSNMQYNLLRSANKLVQDIRVAQQMAMTTKSYNNCSAGYKLKGYGVEFVQGNNFYHLMVRCENAGIYSDSSLSSIPLETGVEISNLTFNPSMDIFFYPPDPTVDLKNGMDDTNVVTITIRLQSDHSKTKTIEVNKSGLINVQ